jgi:3-hydroxy acid dehydrogenase/malonic semialdehyde reductase
MFQLVKAKTFEASMAKQNNSVQDSFYQGNRKLVIITGASSGFGQACAKKFADNGWLVLAAARRQEKLEQLRKQLGEDNCLIQPLDVTQADSIDSLMRFIQLKQLSVNLLINNAGLALGLSAAHQADLSDWQTMIDTNITGLTRMTRAILPLMVDNHSGHIINLGSIAGSYAYPGSNVYGASKAFVEQFSLNLRADLAGTGVRVTNIEPGLAQTEFSEVRFHGDKQKAASIYEQVKPLVAEDIAESIFWCANLPEHVNINRLEMMPTCQSFGPLVIVKQPEVQ